MQKVDSVSRLSKFRSLHHLILNWTISDSARGTTDILDLGCLLEAAPFMEKLELHVSLSFSAFSSSLVCRHEVVYDCCPKGCKKIVAHSLAKESGLHPNVWVDDSPSFNK